MAEFVLRKQRILELYRNLVEWDPELYGAQSAVTTTEPRPEYRRATGGTASCDSAAPPKRRPERMNTPAQSSLGGCAK